MRSLAILFLLSACRSVQPAQFAPVASYSVELEACRSKYAADDCEGYLACRHSVQRKHGQPVTLRCETAEVAK